MEIKHDFIDIVSKNKIINFIEEDIKKFDFYPRAKFLKRLKKKFPTIVYYTETQGFPDLSKSFIYVDVIKLSVGSFLNTLIMGDNIYTEMVKREINGEIRSYKTLKWSRKGKINKYLCNN